MTREEAITVLKAFMDNPLFSDIHKAAFSIAIHDIKQHHDWNINKLILVNKDNYEPLEQESNYSEIPIGSIIDWNNCHTSEQLKSITTTKNDLVVDCIVDVLGSYTDLDIPYKREIAENILTKLSSVTPQEPRKGHWTEEFNDLEGEVRFTCSSCGKYQLFGTDFCYHCGSDNREVEEE